MENITEQINAIRRQTNHSTEPLLHALLDLCDSLAKQVASMAEEAAEARSAFEVHSHKYRDPSYSDSYSEVYLETEWPATRR